MCRREKRRTKPNSASSARAGRRRGHSPRPGRAAGDAHTGAGERRRRCRQRPTEIQWNRFPCGLVSANRIAGVPRGLSARRIESSCADRILEYTSGPPACQPFRSRHESMTEAARRLRTASTRFPTARRCTGRFDRPPSADIRFWLTPLYWEGMDMADDGALLEALERRCRPGVNDQHRRPGTDLRRRAGRQ